MVHRYCIMYIFVGISDLMVRYRNTGGHSTNRREWGHKWYNSHVNDFEKSGYVLIQYFLYIIKEWGPGYKITVQRVQNVHLEPSISAVIGTRDLKASIYTFIHNIGSEKQKCFFLSICKTLINGFHVLKLRGGNGVSHQVGASNVSSLMARKV